MFKKIILMLGVMFGFIQLATAASYTIYDARASPRAVEPGENIDFICVHDNHVGGSTLDFEWYSASESYNDTIVYGSAEWNSKCSLAGSQFTCTHTQNTTGLSGGYSLKCTKDGPLGTADRDGGSFTVSSSFDCRDEYGLMAIVNFTTNSSNNKYCFNLTDIGTYMRAGLVNVDAERANGVAITSEKYSGDIFIVEMTYTDQAGNDTVYLYVKDASVDNSWGTGTADCGVNVTLTLDNFTRNPYATLLDWKHEATNTDYYCTANITNWTGLIRCDDYAPYSHHLCDYNETTTFVTPRQRAAYRADIEDDLGNTHMRENIILGTNIYYYLLTSPFNKYHYDFFLRDFTDYFTNADLYLKKHVSNGLDTMFSKRFDADNWIRDAQLMPQHSYQIIVRKNSLEYSLGYVVAEQNDTKYLEITAPRIGGFNLRYPDLTLGITTLCNTTLNTTYCIYNTSTGNVSLGEIIVYNITDPLNYSVQYNASSTSNDAILPWNIPNITLSHYVICQVNHTDYGVVTYGERIYCGDPAQYSAFNTTVMPSSVLGKSKTTNLKIVSWVIVLVIGLSVGAATSLGMGVLTMAGTVAFLQVFTFIPTIEFPYSLTTFIAAVGLFIAIFEKRQGVAD
jgi:hypothetical protein